MVVRLAKTALIHLTGTGSNSVWGKALPAKARLNYLTCCIGLIG